MLEYVYRVFDWGEETMKIEFRKPTENDAKDISTWKYEGIYSFYDNDKTEAKQEWASNIQKDENAFVMYNEKNELIGNCCFEYDDENNEYSFGVQMRPCLTGKGMGTEVVTNILNFGIKKYKLNEITLLVAKFNARAKRVYEKLGFKVIEEFPAHVNNEDIIFIVMKKVW